jgi:ABC-type Fe3+ transport system permease subunit
LPATLLLRPLNAETLATLVYGHATRGAFEDGALAALVIVAVGIFPVMRLSRGTDQAEPAVVARALDPSPGRTGGGGVLPVREQA